MSYIDQFPDALTPADIAAMTPATTKDFYRLLAYQTVREIGEVIVTTTPFKKEPRYELVAHFVNPLTMTAELNKFQQLMKAGGVYLAPTINVDMEVRGAGTVTINSGGGFGTIIWGDGATDQIAGAGTKSHTYAAGTFALVLKLNVRVNTPPTLTISGPVYSITTLEALTTLTSLTLNGCELSTWPGLPPDVTTLNMNDNNITSISGLPWVLTVLRANINPLMSVDLPGNLTTLSLQQTTLKDTFQLPPTLTNVNLSQGTFTVDAINSFLIQLDANGKSGGTATLSGQTPKAIPTGAGAAAQASLSGKSWTVSVDV